MSPSFCRAAKLKDLQGLHQDITQLVNRSRGLTYAILTEIKQIDETCRHPGGSPIENRKRDAREMLSRVEPLKLSFDNSSRSAEKLIREFEKKFTEVQDAGGAKDKLKADVDQFASDLTKYEAYVKKFYGRAISDFGPPAKPRKGTYAKSLPPVGQAPGLRISGELSGAAGNSSYKRPHADPKTDLTSTNLNLRLAGTLSPSPSTQINFHGSRQNKIEQRKIALTKVGAGINQAFKGDMSVYFNLDYNDYSDDDYDSLGFGDLSLGGGFAYQGKRIQGRANLKHMSRSYGDYEVANYGILTFNPDLTLMAGRGSVNLGLNLLKKSHKEELLEILDHQEFSPYFNWEFSPGGPELNFTYQQFTHPNDDDSKQDNNRIKASFYNKKTGRFGGRVKYGPEVALYQYPNAEENDFADFAFILDKRSGGRKASMTSLRIVYRKYEAENLYDFAQATFRKSKRPMGSGFGWQMNLAGRYYTESSDENDSLRFASVHEPHTLDFYHSMGWTKTTKGKMQELTFGPIIGAKFYFDTEREDAFETEVDYVWKNPRNTLTGGLNLKTVILASPVFRIRVQGRYQINFLYNAEPVRNYSLTRLDLLASYAVGPRLQIEGRGRIHSTRADIKSDTDLDETSFTLLVRYLFDVVR
jgi:hypothetical protein